MGKDDTLWEWASGVPPAWCDSASAAEAWALATVLKLCAQHPSIVTDCLGLINTAASGIAAATTSRRHLARVWSHMADALDGKIETLVGSKLITWMPAHKSAADIGNRLQSNGSPITRIDWRANRLVDGLAKLAAASEAASEELVKLTSSADHLIRHAAAQWAVASYNVNNHKIVTEDCDSNAKMCIIRDSSDFKPAHRKFREIALLKALNVPECAQPTPQVDDPNTSSDADNARTFKQIKAANQRRRNKSARDQVHAATSAIVLARRMNHREAAIDLHRRQLIVATMAHRAQTAPDAGWDSFLGLCDNGSGAEQRQRQELREGDCQAEPASTTEQPDQDRTPPVDGMPTGQPSERLQDSTVAEHRPRTSRPVNSYNQMIARSVQLVVTSILGGKPAGTAARALGTPSMGTGRAASSL